MSGLIRQRYEPLAEVGAGGQGRVVQARDTRHDRLVAVKITGTDGVTEARVLLELQPHPALPLVREDFFEGGSYCIVTDWVHGRSLDRVLAERGAPGLPIPTVIEWLMQTADALDHLHAHIPPILHRDVKPANLILTPGGRVVLVDFGLSRADVTSGGTPGFAAPELAAGTAPSVAADVYSLAATAFALVTGEPPSGVLPDIAPAVLGVLRKGLATDPAQRPDTATAFVALLRSAVSTDLPRGVVTFLITDVEGSTRLLQDHGRRAEAALAANRRMVAETVGSHGGVLPADQGEGDGAIAVFEEAPAALRCALDIQRRAGAATRTGDLQVRVRVAVHTGQAEPRDGTYYGLTVNRVSRLCGIGRGGHVLVSGATRDAAADALPDGATLVDLGSYVLRDVAKPERVFQFTHDALDNTTPPLRGANAPGNLPAQLTSFVGRAGDIEQVRRLLAAHRLVTIAGMGGCGKTRIALEAPEAAGFPDGRWFVDLTQASADQNVAACVKRALSVADTGRDDADEISQHLEGSTSLVILDNAEHVLRPTALLASQLLTRNPYLRILVTSRQPLGTTGEAVWSISGLPIPDDTSPEVQRSDAVRLFCDRALLTDPAFSLTDDNAGAVVRICRRLEGIPLAIELAAAKLRVLSVHELADRLHDRFRALGAAQGAAPRQHTLRATIDWSWDLLDARLQRVFSELSVFESPWDAGGAQGVCTEHDTDEALAELAERSLIVADRTGVRTRYRMLDTLRVYAAERLAEMGGSRARDRHLQWFRTIAAAGLNVSGAAETRWLEFVDDTIADLHAAIDHAIATSAFEDAITVACALVDWWATRGRWTHGRAVLDRLLPHRADVPETTATQLSIAAGFFAHMQGDHDAARDLLEPCLQSCRASHDVGGAIRCLMWLGSIAVARGEYPTARERWSEALDSGDAKPDDRAWLLQGLAGLRRIAGDIAGARGLFAEAAQAWRTSGHRSGEAFCLGDLAHLERIQGDLDAAEHDLARELAAMHEVRNVWGVAQAMAELARVALLRGDLERASSLASESRAIWTEIGDLPAAASAVATLADAHLAAGDAASARDCALEGLEMLRDGESVHGNAAHVAGLAEALLGTGDTSEARRFASEAVLTCERTGDARGLAAARCLLAEAGGYDRHKAYVEALTLHSANDARPDVSLCLDGLARCAMEAGNLERFVALSAAAARVREHGGWPIRADLRADYDDRLGAARDRLGDEVFESAWHGGASLPLDEAVQLALS